MRQELDGDGDGEGRLKPKVSLGLECFPLKRKRTLVCVQVGGGQDSMIHQGYEENASVEIC